MSSVISEYKREDIPSDEKIINTVTGDYEWQITERAERNESNPVFARAWVIDRAYGRGGGTATKIGSIVQGKFPSFTKEIIGYYPSSPLHGPKRKLIARALHLCISDLRKQKKKKKIKQSNKNRSVYIVGNLEQSVCKVGISSSPSKRFSDIQCGFPWDLYVLRVFQNKDKEFESELHDRLSEKNLQGEWFEIDEDVKDIIGEEAIPVSEYEET